VIDAFGSRPEAVGRVVGVLGAKRTVTTEARYLWDLSVLDATGGLPTTGHLELERPMLPNDVLVGSISCDPYLRGVEVGDTLEVSVAAHRGDRITSCAGALGIARRHVGELFVGHRKIAP
jgi:hypothetical protein